MVRPFLVGSESAKGFLELGADVLRRGGSAVDAVEAAIRGVESNADDHGVGLGGIPNLLGVVQLDASIMDGRTMEAGAVAAVEGFIHPISIARRVMEASPHVLLVGRGAEMFAERMAFKREEALTEYGREFYRAFLRGEMEELGPEFSEDVEYLKEDAARYPMRDWYEKLTEGMQGTVDVMALDSRGDICSGVSTSGTYLKLPGRVGDSPIIGAGNYCDNRVGAAACTGRGELSIRHGTARIIVAYMKAGKTVSEACTQAMREVREMVEDPRLSCVAFERCGGVAAVSTSREPTYYYMDTAMEKAESRSGVWMKI